MHNRYSYKWAAKVSFVSSSPFHVAPQLFSILSPSSIFSLFLSLSFPCSTSKGADIFSSPLFQWTFFLPPFHISSPYKPVIFTFPFVSHFSLFFSLLPCPPPSQPSLKLFHQISILPFSTFCLFHLSPLSCISLFLNYSLFPLPRAHCSPSISFSLFFFFIWSPLGLISVDSEVNILSNARVV